MRDSQTARRTQVLTILGIVVLGGLSVLRLGAQSAAADTKLPAFEVASVKPNKLGPNSPQRAGLIAGDRVSMVNVPLLTLTQIAYPGMTAMIGGPKWMGEAGQPNFDADRFDVTAKAETSASVEQLRLMLQALLVDRFKLVVHTEERQTDVYALRLARSDGTLGPNLHPAAMDCKALVAQAVTTSTPAKTHPCGTVGTNMPPWHVRGVPLMQLSILRIELGRPIVDKTGLSGVFDFDLDWTPRWALDPSFDRTRFPTLDVAGPDILTAMHDQLGLKLVSEKDAQRVLVIDHVEKPTEN